MKTRIPLHWRLFFWTLVFLLHGNLAACSAAAPIHTSSISHIRVTMDNNYPPYAFLDERGEMQGILVDQWKLWEKRTGVQVEIIGMPWNKALDGMKNGEFDAIDTIFYTDERAKIFDFTKPYAQIDVRIFFPSAVSGIGDIAALRGFRVAVKKSDANADYLVARGITDLSYYDSYEDIVKAAAAKKETIFVVDQPPALYFLYKYGLQNQFNYSEPLYGGEFHRAVKKGNAELLALINSGFENISAKEYQQINDRWFGTNQYVNIERVIPYLEIGAALAALILVILIIFNRILRARVKLRTQELEESFADLKTSETLLRENQKFLADLIERGEALIFVKDCEGRYELINRKWEEVTGLKREQVIGHTDMELFPGLIGEQFRANDVEVIESNKAIEREEVLDDPSGRRYFLSVKFPLRAEDGKVKGMCGITTEITERKRAETKYQALIENAPAVIYLDKADGFGSNIYISAQVEKLLGYTPADFEKNPRLWHKVLHPEDYDRAIRTIENTLALGGATEEYRMIKRDGDVIWVRDSSVPIRDELGRVMFVQGFLEDVTESKKAKEKLKESEGRYRALFEDSPIPLLEEDFSAAKLCIDRLREEGVQDLRAYFKENPRAAKQCADTIRVIEINKATLRWYQAKSKAELQGGLSQFMNESGYKSLIEEIIALAEGGNRYEFAVSRQDQKGAPQHLIVSGIVAPTCEETWERVLISIVDITKRKQAEENLAKQLELLRGLRVIDQAIITNVDLSANLNVLIREIIAQLHVDAASISLFDDHKPLFTVGQGFITDAEKFIQLNAASGLSKRAARERHNVHVRDLQEMDYPFPSGRAIKEEGFIAYYGVPLTVKDQLLGVLEIFQRAELDKNEEWLAFLETLAGQAAITINSATLFNDLQSSTADIQLAYDATLEGWSHALDLRDKETEGHTLRVTELTLQLARKLGVSAENMIHIKRGSLLHDIGKMGIPDSILLKPGPLTDEEWDVMRMHPIYACEMLEPIKYLEPALDIPRYHHERWDGSGYPYKLKGEQIPFVARIFTVVDVWDALTSNRPYRSAWEKEKVKEYLRQGAGAHFDQHIVDVFLQMIKDNSA